MTEKEVKFRCTRKGLHNAYHTCNKHAKQMTWKDILILSEYGIHHSPCVLWKECNTFLGEPDRKIMQYLALVLAFLQHFSILKYKMLLFHGSYTICLNSHMGFIAVKLLRWEVLYCLVTLTLNNSLIIFCQYHNRLPFSPERNKQNAFVNTIMQVQKHSHNTKL